MWLLEVQSITKHGLLVYMVHHALLHHRINSVIEAPY